MANHLVLIRKAQVALRCVKPRELEELLRELKAQGALAEEGVQCGLPLGRSLTVGRIRSMVAGASN